MWIKICGNTRLEDCQLAAELGADAVGFVFAEGKRTVTAAHVAAITAQLPAELEKVGVFTTRNASEILDTARQACLTGIQLHGPLDLRLTREICEGFAPPRLRRILQVLQWWTDAPSPDQQEAFATEAEAVQKAELADALLIDSRTRNVSGGTGVAFDWNAAKSALVGLRIPVIVAGGLRPENVAEAVHILRPWGVDVSSGVELAPGIKDPDKLKRFMQAVGDARG